MLPETNLALFWPAAGVGALWALVTPTRRQLAVVAGAIAALSTVGLSTGITPSRMSSISAGCRLMSR